jgi:predicted nucleic acid-binding Zn ribbon protein
MINRPSLESDITITNQLKKKINQIGLSFGSSEWVKNNSRRFENAHKRLKIDENSNYFDIQKELQRY